MVNVLVAEIDLLLHKTKVEKTKFGQKLLSSKYFHCNGNKPMIVSVKQ